MGKIAAIAVRYGGQDVPAVARSFQHDLCNPRKVFPDRVSIFGVGGAELVKIDLLIEIQIDIGPLAFAGKPRVINARALRVPSRAATGRGILNVSNGVRQCLSGGSFVKM